MYDTISAQYRLMQHHEFANRLVPLSLLPYLKKITGNGVMARARNAKRDDAYIVKTC